MKEKTTAVSLILAWMAVSAAAGQSGGTRLTLCSDDSPAARAFFLQNADPQLSQLDAVAKETCLSMKSQPSSSDAIFGTFELDNEGNVLLSFSRFDTRRSRVIPWLASTASPLKTTTEQGKISALCIICDNLVLELESLDLSDAPELPLAEPEPTALTPDPSEPTEPPLVRSQVIELFGGIKYIAPRTAAPLAGLGYAIYLNRMGLALDAYYEFDSNFELSGRAFTTWALAARLGLSYLAVQRSAGVAGVEASAHWRLNTYRRDNLVAAKTHRWSDFGAGFYLFGRYNFSTIFGVFAKGGMQVFPTAHIAKIADGPKQRVENYSIVLLYGLNFLF